MNYISNTICRAQKFTLLSLLLFFAIVAKAEVKVTMSDFTVAAGQTHEVAVNVTNDEVTGSSVGVDITLPEGLEFVAAYGDEAFAKKSDTRLTSSHVISAKIQADGALRVSIYSAGNKVFNGNDGAVFYFTVKASASLADTDYIKLNGKINSKSTSNQVSAECAVHNPDKYIDAVLSTNVESVSAKVGDVVTLDVELTNATSLSGLQGDIVLPEGLEPVLNEKEQDYLTPNYDRLTDSHSLSSTFKDNTLKVLLFSASNANLLSADGALFTITLKVVAPIEDAKILLTNFQTVKSTGYFAKDFDDLEVSVTASVVEVSPESIQAILGDSKYGLVEDGNEVVAAAIAEQNEKFANGEVTEEEALANIEAVVKAEEQKTGDFDLSGEIDVDDVQAIIDAVTDDVPAVDYNGDGEIDIDDVQWLLDYVTEM